MRTALRFGLCALVVLCPLPFGSVQPWALLTLEILAACMGAGTLWLLYRDPAGLSKEARFALALGCGLLFIGALQLIPVPASWVRLAAEPTAGMREVLASAVPEASTPLAPVSLSPPDTLDALLRLVMYVLVGLAAAVAVRSRRHLRQVVAVVVAAGAFQALYGSAEYLSGHQHIFAYAKKYYLDEATGTFINKNHFASYLAMALPLSLGLVLESISRFPRQLSWRERFIRLEEPATIGLALGGIASFLIWIGVFLSYSRGGLAAALVATGVLALMTTLSRRRFVLLLAAFLVPAAFLCWQELTFPGERFVTAPSELPTLNNRVPVWQASLHMVPDHALLGSGYGTFESAFLKYKPPGVRSRWDHVHNDWLQLLVEGGVGASLILLAFVYPALSVRKLLGRFMSRHQALTASVPAAIAGAACHSFFDFPLRIPALALQLSFLIGVLCSFRFLAPELEAGAVRRLPEPSDSDS